MTDAMSSSIIQETILPRFKAGDMPGGIVAGAQAIGEQMKLPLEAAEAKAKAQADKASTTHRQNRRSGGGFPFGLLFWGIILVFVILPMFGFSRFGKRRRQGPWGARRYRGGNDGGVLPIILWSIASEISRGARDGGGSSGWGGGDGGGWGGGSGGGGGFSGGGGSFGGGGASGSW